MEESYRRFSRVAENYARYRPRYPLGLIDLLEAECGLSPNHILADVGSGTGLLTELFLKNGYRVFGVEPNPEMRSAAERLLRAHPSFTSIAGTAEATTLPSQSVHMITAGQAFHWFEHNLAKQEFSRILKPPGWVVLVYNLPRDTGTPFDAAIERFWRKFNNPRPYFISDRQRPDSMTEFFGPGNINEKGLGNHQICNFETLRGRVLSSSSSPKADDPRYPAMLEELEAIFNQHQAGGTVTLEYDTRVVYGRLSPFK